MGENEQINQGLQDAADEVGAKVRPSLPKRPYKFLDYFEAADQPIFFGRDEEVNHLVQRIMAHRLTVLFGQSGVGKTSLINAGVIPRLEEEGYTSLYLRVLHEPAASIRQAALQLRQDITSPSSILHSPISNLHPLISALFWRELCPLSCVW